MCGFSGYIEGGTQKRSSLLTKHIARTASSVYISAHHRSCTKPRFTECHNIRI